MKLFEMKWEMQTCVSLGQPLQIYFEICSVMPKAYLGGQEYLNRSKSNKLRCQFIKTFKKKPKLKKAVELSFEFASFFTQKLQQA